MTQEEFEVKRKAGRPKGAKNKTTLLAQQLTKAGVGRVPGGDRLMVNPRKVRLAEKRLNDLLRDRSLTVNQVLFAAQLIAVFSGIEIPLGLTGWEKRTIRALIEDRTLLHALKKTTAEQEAAGTQESDADERDRERTQRTAQALSYLRGDTDAG